MAESYKVENGVLVKLETASKSINLEEVKQRKKLAENNIIIENGIINECNAILEEAAKHGLE